MMTSGNTPRHILIVEDDVNTADMLTAYFGSLGYEVSHAAWGKDAIDMATNAVPDLVVLDIHLPDIDGYQVCMQLRSQRRTENIPIIFLTERRDRMDRLTGLNLGAIDYITKPFDVQEMRYRVRNILRRSSTETFLHPVTGLPILSLVKEELQRARSSAETGIIRLTIKGMEPFGDAYGFVTHDDVLRAVVLILKNTVSEFVKEDPFVGQVDAYDFLICVPDAQRYLVMGRLHQRLNEAISFFYPHQDWESGTLSTGEPVPRIDFELTYVAREQIPEDGDPVQLRKLLSSTEMES